jgi:hypothetical protein
VGVEKLALRLKWPKFGGIGNVLRSEKIAYVACRRNFIFANFTGKSFQQPRDLSPTISRGRVNFVPIFTMAVRTSIMTASRDNENDLHKPVKLNF